MSTTQIQTFGEMIRNLRELREMPLRKLAAYLDIDQSTLSKIERNERKPNSVLIRKLSLAFGIDRKQLYLSFISDKVAQDLLEEESPDTILKLAIQKINYLKSRSKKVA